MVTWPPIASGKCEAESQGKVEKSDSPQGRQKEQREGERRGKDCHQHISSELLFFPTSLHSLKFPLLPSRALCVCARMRVCMHVCVNVGLTLLF